jgi:glyoxylase-like metal-dependent hydrolase (beta-lactamase superfamily II)
MIQLPDDIVFFERGWLSSNNFLLRDAHQAWLVDTGYYSHAQQTEALLKSVLHDRPLTHIVNTHLHSDHCGGNAHLQTIYPNVHTLIPPGLSKHVVPWDDAGLTYAPTGQHCPPFSFTKTICSGDSFVIANRKWTAFSAPGHDPHSIIIFEETNRILISADALWENGFGVVFPEIEGIDAFDEVNDTLDLIAKLKPKLVLPGHGQPFTDVESALDRAKSRLHQFTSSENKHSDYAAKVLLKFKLLEFQQVSLTTFIDWGCKTPYLQLLHKKYQANIAMDSWIHSLCGALEKSGACLINDQVIVNT